MLPTLVAAGDIDTAIDPIGLSFYMSFHAVVPPPYTILKGVRKLPPATVRVIEPDGTQTDNLYWSLRFMRSSVDLAMSPAEWKERVGTALRRAVEWCMVVVVVMVMMPVRVCIGPAASHFFTSGILRSESMPARPRGRKP
jgi:asparagine synthase (glutamine-hydrolysing)